MAKIGKEFNIDSILQFSKDRDRYYQKLDKDQLYLYECAMTKLVTCSNSKAGTGKTTTTVLALS